MRKKRLLVAASNTDCGKTYLSLKLLQEFAQRGLRIGAIKPIETGVDTDPLDGKKLFDCCRKLNPGFAAITLEDVAPVRYPLPAAPYISKGDEAIDFDKIRRAYEKIEAVSDIVLIESAGGLMTPIDEGFYVIDLAEFFGAEMLFFTTDKLGTISESIVNLAYLDQRKITYRWGINRMGSHETFDAINRPFLEKRFGSVTVLPDELERFVSDILA